MYQFFIAIIVALGLGGYWLYGAKITCCTYWAWCVCGFATKGANGAT